MGAVCLHLRDWVDYNNPTATSLEMRVNRCNYPQMTLIQVSETIEFTQIDEDH